MIAHKKCHFGFLSFSYCCLLLPLLAACSTSAIVHTATHQVMATHPQAPAIHCPAPGQARPAEMSSLKVASQPHATLVYVEENDHDGSVALRRYDSVTRQQTDVIRWTHGIILSQQISADDQWILFTFQLGNQFSLNVVRVDGQHFQTLYCSDGQSMNDLRWSPNQRLVLFDSRSGIFLLNLASGQLQLEVGASVYRPSGFSFKPRLWLDNTRVYLDNTFYAPSTDADALGDLTTLVLLDISRGPHQQIQDLRPVFHDPGNLLTADAPCSDLTTSFDGTKSLLSQCRASGLTHSHSYITRSGPGTISVLPVTGGQPQQIVALPTLPVTTLRLVNRVGTEILFAVDDSSDVNNDHYVGSSQNGLWKVNTDGSGLKQLIISRAGQHVFLDPAGQFPWSTVSADGSKYAVLQYQSVTLLQTLVVGSLDGGQPTTLVSISHNGNGTSLAIVGWTML